MWQLSKSIEYSGPRAFSRDEIAAASDAFSERSALIYTPTSNLPKSMIGSGLLDVFVPLPIPSFHELNEISGYRNTRLWLDLIQRRTGKIRWSTILPANVMFVCRDVRMMPQLDLIAGSKALLDSLKIQSSGRRDGQLLYYFGVIKDDDSDEVCDVKCVHEIVARPEDCGTRIIVDRKSVSA